MTVETPETPVGLRADASRNRQRILEAARDVFAEQGADAPLDDIARRAGVGNATLYRRFPDRAALMRAVALDLLRQSAEAAEAAAGEEPDAFRALARYMHAALDIRISAVMQVLTPRLGPDPELDAARDASVMPVVGMVAVARKRGLLRPDVEFGDIGLTLARLSRPLPEPISRPLSDQIAHRHLELMLAGMRATANSEPLPGPSLTLADLRNLPPSSDADGDPQVKPNMEEPS